jgi:cytosine/adenosine deaminase-related metal-dependent hydrolase
VTGLSVVRAAWVVPITRPPIRDGWVAARDGRIVAIGAGTVEHLGDTDTRITDLGDVALVPGLVNAHAHLELAALRNRVPPAPSMPQWVRGLLSARAAADASAAGEAAQAVAEAVACGTVAIADTSNTLAAVPPLSAAGISAVVFHEVLGFDPAVATERAASGEARIRAIEAATGVRVRLAAHAVYSTSADLICEVGRRSSNAEWPCTSIHLAESPEEGEFLMTGRGPWRDLLGELGVPHASWIAPGLSPTEYLDRLGLWRPGALAVHGVHASDRDLALLAARDATLVTCPRSNLWVGAGPPPVQRFASAGVRVALGTDSLASAPDLNLFAELETLRTLAPDIPPRTLLTWATLHGARALGLEADLGSLDAGKVARFLAVRLPRGVADVEAALAGGVRPAHIEWIDVARRQKPVPA